MHLYNYKDHMIQRFCRVSNQAWNRVPILSTSTISLEYTQDRVLPEDTILQYLEKVPDYFNECFCWVQVCKVLGITFLNACEHIYWLTLACVYMKDLFSTSLCPFTTLNRMSLKYCRQERTNIISLFSFYFLVCYPRLCSMSFTKVS